MVSLGLTPSSMEHVVEQIDLKGQPLDLALTLACGQAFRWRKHKDGVWQGVVRDRLVELKVDNGTVLWRTYPDGGRALVEDYLRLADDVNSIYARLSECDPCLSGLISKFRGLRLLRQDPTETLFSFLCSTANTIPRIRRAIEEMARQYGEIVCEKSGVCYHAFPSLERLASIDPVTLNKHASLGFRATHIAHAGRQVCEHGEGWLLKLRYVPYACAREQLLSIRGVGRKIADCVCLFALDKDEAVPVDTHIRRVAQRSLLPEVNGKSLTSGIYQRVVEAFRLHYGELAGWAQQFLYYEDLLQSRTQPYEDRTERDQENA